MLISKWPGFPTRFICVGLEVSTYVVKCLLTSEALASDAHWTDFSRYMIKPTGN